MAQKLDNIINNNNSNGPNGPNGTKINNIINIRGKCINKGHDDMLIYVKICKWCKSIVCGECTTINQNKCINCTRKNRENWGYVCLDCGAFKCARICAKCGQFITFWNRLHCDILEFGTHFKISKENGRHYYCDECCNNLNEDKKNDFY